MPVEIVTRMIEDLFFDMARSKESLLREEVEMTRASLEPCLQQVNRLVEDFYRVYLSLALSRLFRVNAHVLVEMEGGE